MKEFLLLIFLKIIATVEATKPKSVNIALETVLEFDQKNNAGDVRFLDNVQEFLDKVKSVIRTNPTARRFQNENKDIKFTDFLKSMINILKNYDDEDLEDVFAVFDDEIRKYHYRGCKFYELLENQNVRRFVANKLEDTKEKPAEELRQDLNKAVQVIEEAKFSGPRSEFLDYVNSLYRKDSAAKLRKFLNNLQTYSSKSKRANINLIKVVQDGVRSIIFDHYSKLNANARRDLKIKLETSWRSFKYPDKVERNVWTARYTNSHFKIKSKNINNKTRHIKHTTEPTDTSMLIKDSDSKELATERYNDESDIANDTREVYFKDAPNKLYSNDYDSDTAKSLLDDIESSESSESDEMTTTKPIRKQKDKKHKTTEKYVKPNKHRHNKKPTTINTIYPERLTVDRVKRFKIKPTTKKAKLYTLWKEKIKHKNLKLKRSQSKTNLRTGIDVPMVIADSDTVINVNRAVLTFEENNERKNERNREKSTEHQTKDTQSNNPTKQKMLQKLTTLKYIKPSMSIESFEIVRRSFNKDNASDEIKTNVMRRINQLEKQMEEVKMKINTKTTNATIKTTKIRSNATDKITTTADTKFTDITSETTKPSRKHTVETTKIIKKDFNKTIDITTAKEDKTTRIKIITRKENITTPTPTKTTTITTIARDKKNTLPNEEEKNYQDNLNPPDEANDIAIDDDLDDEIDNIIKKYNISVTSLKPKFNKFISETKLGNKDEEVKNKEEEVKGIIENDLKKIFATTTQKSVESKTDALHDINALLDLGDI